MWIVEAWDQVKICFPDTSNGSRVVVTTRQSDVADCVGSSQLAMSSLDEFKSWDLFCKKAFGEQECPVELEDVGKRIVKKCRGLPLAIVVVAGHPGKSSKSQEYWENVADNMSSVLSLEENKHFLDVLSFSYSYLPAHLKPCFVYMGTYREDEEIFAAELIKCWIAQGFIRTCEAKDLEEIGEDYLKDLIGRNLILPICTDMGGEVWLVGIHDVLRELCIKIAEKEKFLYVVHGRKAICREHEGVADAPPLVRSLIWEYGVDEQSFDLRLLRLLRTADDDFQQLNLRDVKYLLSSGVQLRRSPLSLLWNLQTLSIETLYEFWEMVQLRNLWGVLYPGIHLPDPLPSDQVMQNLKTLKVVVNLKLSEEVCERIPNIKELGLRYYYDSELEFLRSSSYYYYYCLHNLGRFRKLESLSLEFSFKSDIEWGGSGLSLELPSSLKKLFLYGCHLYDWEEITRMGGSLPHLECLCLESISSIESEWTLVEETFPRLKVLRIYNCDDLVYWNVDSSSFPLLQHLVIVGLRKWDEIPRGIGEIPTLQSIFLSGCSDRLMISTAKMVKESQEEHGNEELKLEFHFGDGMGDEEESFMKKLEFLFGDGMGEEESFMKKLEEEGLTPLSNLHIFPEYNFLESFTIEGGSLSVQSCSPLGEGD